LSINTPGGDETDAIYVKPYGSKTDAFGYEHGCGWEPTGVLIIE
jgi:hypothetical protein